MKVVLRKDLSGIGKRGDIVDVPDGYARNYLLPHKSALKATDGITAQAAAMRKSRDLKDHKDRGAAEVVAQELVPKVIVVKARSGTEGRLFGSVTHHDILEAVLAQTGIDIDRHKVLPSGPIKTVGNHQIQVRLHPDVEFPITVAVESE
jgi:large subunit ribosomal protein L9